MAFAFFKDGEKGVGQEKKTVFVTCENLMKFKFQC